jgi:uncharacterized protein DUF3107
MPHPYRFSALRAAARAAGLEVGGAPDSVGAMEVRIGVLHTPKELSVHVDSSAEEVTAAFDKALAGESVFWLTDDKGRRVGVPAERIAYLEIEADGATKRVGFGAS